MGQLLAVAQQPSVAHQPNTAGQNLSSTHVLDVWAARRSRDDYIEEFLTQMGDELNKNPIPPPPKNGMESSSADLSAGHDPSRRIAQPLAVAQQPSVAQQSLTFAQQPIVAQQPLTLAQPQRLGSQYSNSLGTSPGLGPKTRG